MLREAKGLHGATLHALDGEIGRVDEILFDDEHWTVRYLIVDTGGWLLGRKVLISPMAFGLLNWEQHTLNINLTRKQIENSPGVATDAPVSRQWETGYYDYYAWPYYWDGIGGWGGYWYPGALFAQQVGYADTPQQGGDDQRPGHADAHLRSTKEVTGYAIAAADGHLGHVEDFIVNDETWRICYLAIDTRDWWPDRKSLLPTDRIGTVTWEDRSVAVHLTRDQVRKAPEWDPGEPIDRTFEDQLYAYYSKHSPPDREGPGGDMPAQLNHDTSRETRHEIHKESRMTLAEPMETLDQNAIVAIYDTHNEAETAVRDLQRLGFDMSKLSIVGKDYHTDEDVVGYYTTGDRMKSWGKLGAFWGGIWGLLFGSAFFLIPGVGPLLFAGPIITWIIGALEGAVVVGGLSALGAALVSIGIPKDSVIAYETQIKAGKFVVIAHGVQSARDRSLIAEEASRHQGIEQHAVLA